jgi:hypothetical protein
MLLGEATRSVPVVVLPSHQGEASGGRLPQRLMTQSACTLTAEESVPTGTVVSPVAIFAPPSSSISAERSPNYQSSVSV